ncbi:MAG TPA: AbrB/MazE/SpoVT family DNA-binding domain-containing protein [Terriglobia bacterium]|nr:AbrB/MazE/SpoVT family DNA-binding domain-containing protein [Terriglobia bacterium]
MTAKLQLDKAGRIVLPKPVRDGLQLSPGDTLELETSGEQITLRPLRGSAPLHKKRGVWVYRAGERLSEATVRETLEQVRRERDFEGQGNKR